MNRIVVSLLASMFLSSLFLFGSGPAVHAASVLYAEHAPIVILGNADFQTPGNGVVGGAGTANDPYVIEGWDINASEADGIVIRNTSAYFLIRNSFIHGAASYFIYFSGIALTNVSHGRVENSTLSAIYAGVSLDGASDIEVARSQLGPGTGLGISATASRDLRISSSNFSEDDFGISIYASIGITVSNSTFTRNRYGVFCYECSEVNVSGSVFTQHSAGIELSSGGENASLVNNTIQANYQWGLYVNYMTNVTISGNTFTGSSDVGMYGFANTNITVQDNNFSSNGYEGLRLHSNAQLTVDRNLMERNGLGVEIGYGSNSTFEHNRVANNTNEGLLLHNSREVWVHGNSFERNGGPGVSMYFDEQINISSNDFTRDGVYIQPDFYESPVHFTSHAISPDNLVNGLPIGYFKDCNGLSVDGASLGQLIVANCTDVRIANLTISDADFAIQMDFIDGVELVGNTIQSNVITGVLLYETKHVRVHNNSFLSNSAGVRLITGDSVRIENNFFSANGRGLSLEVSRNLTVANNEISDSTETGIVVLSSTVGTIDANRIMRSNYSGIELGDSSDLLVMRNFVGENRVRGIGLGFAGRITIRENRIEANPGIGLHVFYATHNRVIHNDFINNSIQALESDSYFNEWDEGYPSGGNYWSDYPGVDACSGVNQTACPDPDYLGDTPYVVTSPAADRYPLMQTFETNTAPRASFEVEPPIGPANLTFVLDASGSVDREDRASLLEVRWDWEDDGVWDTGWSFNKTASHVYPLEENVTIRLQVRDAGGLVGETVRTAIVDSTTPATIAFLNGTMGLEGWFVTPVFVTLVATDDRSGVGDIFYRIDGAAWRSYAGRIAIDLPGAHTVDYYSRDRAGNAEPVREFSLQIDSRPPVTHVQIAGTPGTSGWYVSPVNVTLNSVDATSGVGSTEYRVDGGSWQSYLVPFSMPEGRHNITVRSTDRAGNHEAETTTEVRVDLMDPLTSVLVDGAPPVPGMQYPWTAVVTLESSDSGSGIASTFYRIAGGTWIRFDGVVPLAGEQTLDYYSIDRAGNQEAIHSVTLRIGDLAVTPTASLAGTRGMNGWFTSQVQVVLEANGSAAMIRYRLDGGPWNVYATPFTIADGEHVLEFQTVDAQGTEGPLKQVLVRVDSTAPHLEHVSVPDRSVGPSVSISWSGSDGTSGLMRYDVQVDGGSWQSVGLSMNATFSLADGSHEIRVRAVDWAGNVEETSNRIRVDTNVFSFEGPLNGAPTIVILVTLGVIATLLGLLLRSRARRPPTVPGSPPPAKP